jgi:hypothetical protein
MILCWDLCVVQDTSEIHEVSEFGSNLIFRWSVIITRKTALCACFFIYRSRCWGQNCNLVAHSSTSRIAITSVTITSLNYFLRGPFVIHFLERMLIISEHFWKICMHIKFNGLIFFFEWLLSFYYLTSFKCFKLILDLRRKIENYTKIALALTVTSVRRCDELVTTIWMPECKLLDINYPEGDFTRNSSVPSEILQS